MLIWYEHAGDGPPVVLVHAGVADSRMWDAQWTPLSERFHLVRVDLRGFGQSPLPAEPYADADDIAAVLDRLGVDRASLVGASFGGQVALEFATRYRDRVRSLVLLCAAYAGLEPTDSVRRFGEQEDALLASGALEAAVDLNVRTWLGPEASTAARELVREMQRRAFVVQLAAYEGDEQPERETVPVDPAAITAASVVVSGAHDLDHFQAVARHLATSMPNASLVELPWAGHLPSLERPDELTDRLISWLA